MILMCKDSPVYYIGEYIDGVISAITAVLALSTAV